MNPRIVSKAVMIASNLKEETDINKSIKLGAALNLLTIASTSDEANTNRLIQLADKLISS